MKTGIVKFFNEVKGFGFIQPDDSNEDIFVHSSGVKSDRIKEGDKVIFEIEKGKKGLQAINVNLVKP